MLVPLNFAYASYDSENIESSSKDGELYFSDPYTDPEAVIIEGGKTSTADPSDPVPYAIDSLEVIKGSVSSYETGVGAHYYAFGAMNTTYTEAFTNIKLPTSLNSGNRNAYISLGIHGSLGGVDIGLTNWGDGWMPYYYDGYGSLFVTYPNYAAPSTATNAKVCATVVDTTTLRMYVQYLDSSGNVVGNSLWVEFSVASGNFTTSNGKVNCQFYRFASLIPKSGEDNQMDSKYMLGGQFTNCQLYNGSNYESWGIGNSNMVNVWKVSPERISLSYSGTTDTFSIDHWYG